MSYLTIEEMETRAYFAGNTTLSDTLVQMGEKIAELEEQIETLEEQLGEAINDSLSLWEDMNGSADEYEDFFQECFKRLNGNYPCPSITSEYDKGLIFAAIERGEGITE